ncbi:MULTISPECIES: mechanosensitive ion channel family protein [Desulfotignum]|jgi:miniconductance mechanosensitive channel|uniref:Mechanosensing system component YbdG n=1 Tax=Desulfotignum phosphitoxidans DSM 13687 TaxID=1286635 RepID=S0FXB6_9BACT|nr:MULTISPECIES: mechanosensitive ion channel family protein [Desulfotignum]EMS79678.1 miniconductance mechanosensitive channel [Desulfotignum phosphitoxidans DSM 13687]
MDPENFNEWLASLPKGTEAVLHSFNITPTPLISVGIALGMILVIAVITHFLLHKGLRVFLERGAKKSQKIWKTALHDGPLFQRVAFTIQAVLIQVQAKLWLDPETLSLAVISMVTRLWIILFSLLTVYAILDALLDISRQNRSLRELPLRGIFQSIKLITAIMAMVFVASTIIGKSPVILFSGLGAMTAVLMLIFKDPIMGLVGGIQLSANRMLSVGDWLEMPKYGANGDVIDVTLTSVKVQNWDKTITTIPTYALISDSFKNWRGMQESGGRRIMRNIHIDATSVYFLSEEQIACLGKASLLTEYMDKRLEEINRHNTAQELDMTCPINGRRLTNLGTFRAYLDQYLRNHPGIHQGMTMMVRQLEPGADGVPIQIYAFANTTAWVEYEGIQSDIFDHVLAVVPQFGLRLHQTPTGHDIRAAVSSLEALKTFSSE